MRLHLVRLLTPQRALYDMPRDANRFRAYLAMMTGGTDDLAVPITAMNPMGKDVAKAAYDRLIALRAEDACEKALSEAAQRLSKVEGDLRVAMAIGDDVQGAWTHRTLSEAHEFADLKPMLRRGWCAITFYTSEEPSLIDIRRRTLANVYRSLHQRAFGPPKTVEDWLRQEGRAHRFAGEEAPTTGRKAERALLDSKSFGDAYAVLYGDERAKEAGYAALGWKEGEGLRAALTVTRGDDLVAGLAAPVSRSGPSLRP